MRTDRSFEGSSLLKDKAQENFVEDWVDSSRFHQHPGMFDSDNNNPLQNTQEWGHHSHWASSNPAFQADQKRALFSDSTVTQQRPGSYYWQLMNQCVQQEGISPNPGIESWPYSGGTLPSAMSSSNLPAYPRRNGDSFRQNVHSLPRPPHHLFATGGGPIPLSEGGPPSLPPSILLHPFQRQLNSQERVNRILSRYPWETTPPYCAPQTLRQRTGVDTPPRFSTSTNTIYPPSSLLHYDSMSTAPPLSTLPYYSASPFGVQSNGFRNQPNMQLGSQNPDSINYTDHGCYSLPVTTAVCDQQYQMNQRSRPLNTSSTPLTKQNCPGTQNAYGAPKQGLQRRALSDPGPCSLEDSNIVPSNAPPPPPPLRLDDWLKGRHSLRNSRLGVDAPIPSVIQDTNQWPHTIEERKAHGVERNKEEKTVSNENSESESEISGLHMKLSKPAGNLQVPNKSSCCCNSWSSQKKILEEMMALKEANRKICREMRDMRKEIDDLKMLLPSSGKNGLLGWQYPGMEYNPGMISELVEEVREAAHLREEAFLSHIHSSIASQGSSCGCGQALLQDGSGDEPNRKKSNCWWWSRSQQGKANICSPLNSKSTVNPKNKLTSEITELENLKVLLQQVQDEKEQTNMRLQKVEEEITNHKLTNENVAKKSISQQETDVLEEKGEKKSKENPTRQGFDACKSEETVNQEIALLRDEVQKLRMQLQNTLTAKDPIVQIQKIEQLTALLQRLVCPSNGLSLTGSGSAIYTTIGCCPSNLEEDSDKLQVDESPYSNNISVNNASVDKFIRNISFAKPSAGEEGAIDNDERVEANSSPPNSLESNCTTSSSSSHLNFTSGHPPVTIHGPVTDL